MASEGSQPLVDLVIRPERAGEEPAIAAVVEAAFGSPREARLVLAIRSSTGFMPELSLVGERGGRVVGHVMISAASLVDSDTDADRHHRIATLSPLAVTPELQGRGLGSALVRNVTDRADRAGEPVVVLEGDPRFYGRLGFEPAARYGLQLPLPSWAPPEAAQVTRLRRYDPATRGRVVYPPAFEQLDSP